MGVSVAVAVCVATCDRPDGLRRLLAGLAAQRFAKVPQPRVEVVVVDNHASECGRAVCDAVRGEFPFPLEYAVEARRGIPHARNRAVALAAPRADFLAFVDDDEVPEPSWLDELLAAQHAYGADAVAGPVLPHLGSSARGWVRAGSFFDRERHPTGAQLQFTRTGNVLVAASAFARSAEPFEPRFAASGGSDTFFFARLVDEGGTIVWADDAVVQEWVPASRQRVSWVVLRSYRGMIDYVQLVLEREGTLRARGGMALHAVRLLVGALIRLPFAAAYAVRDRGVRLVRTLQRAGRGAGALAAVLGRRHGEYR
jgi:succinoglycan biosynthesis protein ExoM